MTEGGRAVPGRGPVWVGVLDLDTDGPVTAVDAPVAADHLEARVLVRLHGAPLGYITVATMPPETLPDRARRAAQAALGAAVGQHASWDDVTGQPPGVRPWPAVTGCPLNYPGSGPGLTVVICTRDRADGLRDSVRSLQAARYDPLEILVVDNAPQGDATLRLVTALAAGDPRVRYTCEPLGGLSRARNHGLAKASFDLVAFTDDDVLADPGWPAALAAGFSADDAAVCVTGLLAPRALQTSAQRYFDARYSWGEVFEPRRYDLAEHRHPSRLYPFRAGIFGTGANFAVRRSALGAIGEFDPLLGAGGPGRGGEDLDMLLRVILGNGRICYVPSAVVWHLYRDDARPLREQIYSYGHGLGAYLAKHAANPQLRAALLRYGLGQVAAVLSRSSRASDESKLETGGRRMALTEARGVVAGAWHYRRAARRATHAA